jgi:hypothetical protein
MVIGPYYTQNTVPKEGEPHTRPVGELDMYAEKA